MVRRYSSFQKLLGRFSLALYTGSVFQGSMFAVVSVGWLQGLCHNRRADAAFPKPGKAIVSIQSLKPTALK